MALACIGLQGCNDSACADGCPGKSVCVAERCRLACVQNGDCAIGELCFEGYCETGDLRPDLQGDDRANDDGSPGDPGSGDSGPGDAAAGDGLPGDPGAPRCGNGWIDGDDTCDGSDLGALTTCADFGWVSGSVTCMPTCVLHDLSGCIGSPGNCNGIGVAGRQQCDGSELRGESCESLGFSAGTLQCTAECAYDVSGCSLP